MPSGTLCSGRTRCGRSGQGYCWPAAYQGSIRGCLLAALDASLDQLCAVLLGQGGMVGPGSALRSVHSPPCRAMILAVTSVLTTFRRAPPLHKGSFGTCTSSLWSDPMIRLPSPPRTPLPGGGPGATRPFGFHLRARQDVALPLPLAALQRVAVSKSAVLQCQRFGEQPGERLPALWDSHRFPDPRNRYRVLAVAGDLRRQFAGKALMSRRQPALPISLFFFLLER
jgi:hypothetical protein